MTLSPQISSSVGSSVNETRAHYDDAWQKKPAARASLLNLATAMKVIQLPSKTPLDYFKEILWDESLAQDRFFAYADAALVDQVRRAATDASLHPSRVRAYSIPMQHRVLNKFSSAKPTSSLPFMKRTPR
jgi:hypothetical protein